MTALTCELCGHEGPDVATGLVWWRKDAYRSVEAIDRCRDHAACRARYEAERTEPWPVLEGAIREARP